MEDNIPEKLYHYCSVDTFVKIVQNKTLRLCEIAKSNDSMEFQWLERKIIPAIIDREFNKAPFETGLEYAKKKLTELEKVHEIYNSFYSKDGNFYDSRIVFATCLSENGDQLSQWRAYSDNGCGVSIGFDLRAFSAFSESDSLEYNFKKVIYKMEEHEDLIMTELDGFLDALKRKSSLEDVLNSLKPLILKATQISPYVKNSAFREEQEWRIFLQLLNINNYRDIYKTMWPSGYGKIFSDMGTIAKINGIIFYYDLELTKLLEDEVQQPWIKEIIIGPKCHLTERDVRILLGKFGWDVNNLSVRKSSATYV